MSRALQVAIVLVVSACASAPPTVQPSLYGLNRELAAEMSVSEVTLVRGHPAPSTLAVIVVDSAFYDTASPQNAEAVAVAAMRYDPDPERPAAVVVAAMRSTEEGQAGLGRYWGFTVSGEGTLEPER